MIMLFAPKMYTYFLPRQIRPLTGPPILTKDPNKINLFDSIVKDSSADLGVNSKIVQIRPTVKAVSTKLSKKFFCIFVNILIFLRENKEASFFYI